MYEEKNNFNIGMLCPDNNFPINGSGNKSSRVTKTECAVVELPGGSLILNMRNKRNGNEKGKRNGRAMFTTADLGSTWQKHATSECALPEPVCMTSLIRHNYTRKGKQESLLLFSNPNSKYSRNNMTIKVSFDEGKNWCEKNILLDAGCCLGYSCLTSVNENTVCFLYKRVAAHK